MNCRYSGVERLLAVLVPSVDGLRQLLLWLLCVVVWARNGVFFINLMNVPASTGSCLSEAVI